MSIRVRSGAKVSVATIGTLTAVAIPSSVNKVSVTSDKTGGRLLVGSSATAPALTATSYGYLVANVPVSLELVQGRDTYLYVSSDVATTVVYINFSN